MDLSFVRGEFVILGTEYAGEMKKGVFTIMNYIMPKKGILSSIVQQMFERMGTFRYFLDFPEQVRRPFLQTRTEA